MPVSSKWKSTALALTERLANGPAAAHAAIKRLIDGPREARFEDQLAAEGQGILQALASADAREVITAALERRKLDDGALRRAG